MEAYLFAQHRRIEDLYISYLLQECFPMPDDTTVSNQHTHKVSYTALSHKKVNVDSPGLAVYSSIEMDK
jgi:hypothetical protein